MKTQYKALLKETNYLKVVLATFITRIGDGIDMIAFSWLVYEITGSTALVATICGVNMIPNLTFGVISGALCKYVNEKTIMWVCDFGRGICVSLIALLYISGNLQVWHLFVIMFIISTFEAFRAPAQTSIFPKILKEEKRENGLAIQQSIVGTANLVGLACGPICIGLFGLGGAVIVDAFTFLLCGLIILTLSRIEKTITEDKLQLKVYVNDLKEGFLYTKKDKLLTNLCFIGCFANALIVPTTVFEAPYIKDYLHMGSEGIAIIGIGILLGMVIMPPFIPKLKEKMCYRNMVIISGCMIGVFYALYAFLPLTYSPINYIGLALISLVIGVFLALLNFPVQVAMFGRVDQKYLARFSSLMSAMSMGAQPLASFFFGAISGFMRIDEIYFICGVIILIIFAIQKFNKVLLELNQY